MYIFSLYLPIIIDCIICIYIFGHVASCHPALPGVRFISLTRPLHIDTHMLQSTQLTLVNPTNTAGLRQELVHAC